MNSRNRVASYKRGNWRLLDKNFKSKSIKEGDKTPFWQPKTQHSNKMSYQTTNYLTTPTSPNPYITWKLNNMEEAKMIKEEKNNWTRIYHKMLKGLEAMINIQRQVKDVMKIVAEANTIITEIEDIILKASVNNWVINATNITGISEDLRYLIQSDIEN